MSPGLREDLESLLGESAAAARERQAQAFDRAAAPHENSIVIYGAGGMGRAIARGLRSLGIEPKAFADGNPALWDQTRDGLKIFAPADAAKRFGGNAAFVVAVWNPAVSGGVNSIVEMLRQYGCARVVPFIQLFWKHPATFLPNYLWDLPSKLLEAREHVYAAFDLFEEPLSKNTFVQQVRFRLTGDCQFLSPPVNEPQYFPDDIYRYDPGECFVDCGAFDGDTIRAFYGKTGGAFRKIIAFEADPVSFSSLQEQIAEFADVTSRTLLLPYAVAGTNGKLRFSSDGQASASVRADGNIEVDCVALDSALAGECPTLIKMDIEGSELDALRGAQQTIRVHRPVLAICTYHQQDHLWRVPMLCRELLADSRLFIRSYCPDGFDLVCYTVPEHRALPLTAT